MSISSRILTGIVFTVAALFTAAHISIGQQPAVHGSAARAVVADGIGWDGGGVTPPPSAPAPASGIGWD